MIHNVLKPTIKSSIRLLQRRRLLSHSNSESQRHTFYQKYNRGLFSTISLSFPIALWFSTFIYSTYKVRGDSMLPTLQDGDIILVRKSECALIQSIYAYIEYLLPSSTTSRGEAQTLGDHSNDFFDSTLDETINTNQDDVDKSQRQIIQQIDASVGKYPSFFLDNINPLQGSIVVFQNPNDFPKSYHVKRVIGLGGQNVSSFIFSSKIEKAAYINHS